MNTFISYMRGMPLRGRTERIPDKGFILYLLPSIFTLGIFEVYWIYMFIRDSELSLKGADQN